jgi:hypothetical protein
MTAARCGLAGGRRRELGLILFVLLVSAAAHVEHDLAEEEKDETPPEVHIDAEAPGVEGGVGAGGCAEGGKDDAHHCEHETHGDAEVEIHSYLRDQWSEIRKTKAKSGSSLLLYLRA